VAISPNGRWGLSGSHDKTLRLWDLATGRCLRMFEGHKENVWSVAISPDGLWGASAGDAIMFRDLTIEDTPLRLWNLLDGRCLHGVRCDPGLVEPGTFLQVGRTSIVFSPDGQHCVAGGFDGSLLLWELTKGAFRKIEGHADEVNSVAISPDGRWAVSGGDDNTVRAWDLVSESCVHSLAGHMGAVQSVALSSDARYCLSGSRDKTIRLWEFEWEFEFPAPADWDNGARTYLANFLALHVPDTDWLPDETITRPAKFQPALTPWAKARWTEEHFGNLITDLQHAGYGWLRRDGVRRELESMKYERLTE